MEKKHIAMFISSLNKGGSERVLVNLAEYFSAEGYRVTIVTQKRAGTEYGVSPEIGRVLSDITEEEAGRSRILNFLKRFFKLRGIWKTLKPDLILSFIGKNNIMAIATSRFLSVPTVVSVRGEPKEEYYSGALKAAACLLFRRADGVVLQTAGCLEFFPKAVRKKAVVLKNSLHSAFMGETYTGEREKEIVAVGRIDANKNHEMLLRAFASIAAKYPDYRLTIYGEGELRGELTALADSLGLSDRIRLPGSVSDVADRIRKASVFVLSSYSEGMPNTLLEAMALGLPVISTDCPCGGPGELIRHGENGLLTPLGDWKKMAENLQKIINNDSYSKKLGENASKVKEEFNPQAVNKTWKDYLDGKMKKKTASFAGYAVRSVVFLAVFLYILMTLTYVIRTNGDVKDRFTGFYAEPPGTIDVVMIGSSPVYPYYAAPKMWGEYGITAYPISSNLQRPVAGVYMVEEVRKTQSPALYIFEMRMYTARDTDLTNNMAYTRGVTDNMKYSMNRIKTIQAMVDDVSERYTYYFDIFKYHSNWKTIVLPEQLASFRYERLNSRKGYVMTDEVGPCEPVDTSGITEKLAMPEKQEAALYALLDYLKEEELQALFILSPTVMEEEKQKMYNYMEEIIEGYGYEFLDMNRFNQEIGLDFSTDFSDYGGHTNALGAEKCTAFLADYITRNYPLKDRRGEEGYEAWDASYEQWKRELAQAKKTIAKRIEDGDYAEVGAGEE